MPHRAAVTVFQQPGLLSLDRAVRLTQLGHNICNNRAPEYLKGRFLTLTWEVGSVNNGLQVKLWFIENFKDHSGNKS